MYVLIFSGIFVWNISYSKKNSASYYHKSADVSMLIARYSCHISLTGEFSGQIFEKHSDIKFYENPSSGGRVVPRGRTDGQTDE